MRLDAVTFSGGVAEYLYGREKRRFGDLGLDLGHDLGHAIAHSHDLPPVWDPGQGIRATVIGAAQFSVQISGNTILVSEPAALPLHNLPVMSCRFDLAERDRCGRHRGRGSQRPWPIGRTTDGSGPVALPFPGAASRRMRGCTRSRKAFARRCRRRSAAGLPLILLVDGDVGMSLGRVIRYETAPDAHVVAVDGVQLKQFDYVDIGRVIEVTNVVPIIIKSLLFT